MESPFIQYRCFNDPALATELSEILKANSIPFIQESNALSLDLTFSNNVLSKEYIVKLQSADFEKANELLQQLAEKDLDDLTEDHYLYDFTNLELIDIIKKPDEWSSLDYQLAQKILVKEGINVDAEAIRQDRIKELSKPHISQKPWIIIGYIFLPFGSFVSALIGYFLFDQKRTLPNGTRVYAYSNQDRKHGKILLVAGLIAICIGAAVRIYLSIYR